MLITLLLYYIIYTPIFAVLMITLVWIAIFVLSLIILVKAADIFIEAAETISESLHINPFIVGVLIVGFGTSLPELVTSIMAVFADTTEIVVGNAVGSNIANIALVMGFVALLGKDLPIKFKPTRFDIIMLVVASIFLFLTCLDGTFSFIEGVFCLMGISAYMFFAIQIESKAKKQSLSTTDEHQLEKSIQARYEDIELAPENPDTDFKMLNFIVLILSGIFIFIGARFNITAIISLASIMGIGEDIIALTAVALGTSLPELFVSFAAVKKQQIDLAIGNILGSNIFNILMVMGIPAMFTNLMIPEVIIKVSIPLMLGLTAFYLWMLTDKQLIRWKGIALLSVYTTFIIGLYIFG